ncbi:hypothetical protein LRLP16767_LR202_02091 [Limosilactobacillus reuteri]|uniref:Uncharacterized protein n=2 Tax=Limosilactobacillus reuteri TaxID=1598 RepID=A0A0U5JZV3_LIMRT|nr:hypothetical protein LRLP16767_LR202_02091 [Limosilactobacillus reuteri]
MKFIAMLMVPVMFIGALLIKPELIGVGLFVTSLIVEFLIIYLVTYMLEDHL